MRRSLIPLIVLVSFALVSQPNHQAVLITGDTPEGAHSKVEEALRIIESGVKSDGITTYNSGLWGLEEAKEKGARGYDEFWNDTYLMWELLYTKD